MKYSIDQLRQVKGIGEKTIQRIIEQFDESEYISEYNPKIHIEPNSLIHGDMLEKMNGIPDKSVDMILTDLPYGTTACSWDEIIPFDKMWKQYKRVIKDDGAIVLFGSQPFTTKLINSNFNNFREQIIWLKNKSGSGLMAKQRHIKAHEEILVFSNTGKYVYNPQKWLVDKKEFLTQRKTLKDVMVGNNIYNKMEKTQTNDDGTRYPITLVTARVPHNTSHSKEYSSDIEIRLHPTQKPTDLLEYLIKTYTNEVDLVLDSTMGSGSTCVAAKNTNRKYIGIELEKEYYDIAVKRLREEV